MGIVTAAPMKVVAMTGIDTPLPSALPAEESVDVPEPPLVSVATSVGKAWENVRTSVPALLEEPSRSEARHANRKERRRNRPESASLWFENRMMLSLKSKGLAEAARGNLVW